MDRALKERIVGAIVLVVLAVLVVPVFLDGSAVEQEMQTERIPLPGQEDQTVKVIVLERDREAPVPQAVAADPKTESGNESAVDSNGEAGITLPAPALNDETVAETPPPAQAETAEPKAASTQPAAEPRTDPVAVIEETRQSATGMWAVQLGSFSSKPNADKLAADLRRQGFAAFLSETSGDSGSLHRVRVGPQKDRPAAEAMLARLRDVGQRGQVVPHP
jgi:DedD protein